MREHGWVEQRNLTLSAHWGDYSVPLLEQRVGEAIAGRPDVIVCQGSSADPTRKATQSIPIVFLGRNEIWCERRASLWAM